MLIRFDFASQARHINDGNISYILLVFLGHRQCIAFLGQNTYMFIVKKEMHLCFPRYFYKNEINSSLVANHISKKTAFGNFHVVMQFTGRTIQSEVLVWIEYAYVSRSFSRQHRTEPRPTHFFTITRCYSYAMRGQNFNLREEYVFLNASITIGIIIFYSCKK